MGSNTLPEYLSPVEVLELSQKKLDQLIDQGKVSVYSNKYQQRLPITSLNRKNGMVTATIEFKVNPSLILVEK